MLKRILFALLTVAFFCSYSVTYTSVSDECPYIRFSGTTLKDIVVDKSHIKLEQTNTSVIVTFLNGGAQTITWSSAQARSYGYSLDSLYDYVLDILKVQCDTSGGGGSSGTVTSVSAGTGMNFTTITSSGAVNADTTILSTKNYALNIGNNKATFSALDDSINAVRSIRKVDTIYRTAGKDSIIYKINGLYHSIKDSLGGGENLQQTINNGSNITNPSIIVSNLNAGSPVDGVAFIIYPDTTNNTVSSFAYSNDFTHITGSQTKAIVGTNLQIVQMGIYDETSTLDTADLKLMFVNNAGVEKAYFTGLTTNNNTDKFIGVNSATKEIYEIDTSFYVSKNYLNSIGLGSVTSVATGYGLSGGPITTSGTLLVDTSNIASKTYVNSKVASSGGSSSLSSLTAATATNTIDNTNYKQRWSWNTLAGDTALALNSSSTAAASNLNTLLAVTQSGTSSSITQSTFGIKVSNTKVSTQGMNYALYAESSGSGGSLPYGQYNPAVYAKGVEAPIIMDNYSSTGGNYIDYRLGGTEQGYIGFNYASSANYFYLMNKLPKSIIIGTNNTNWLYVGNNSGAPQLGIGGVPTCPFEVSGTAVSSRIMKVHSGFIENDYAGDIAYVHTRAGNFGTIGVNSSGNFIIGINGAGTGTQIAIHATRDNVGMGTVTPVASAKLELSSTTQGFLPPRMTTTQRDAISSPGAGLMIYDTTVNKVSVYNGSTWKYLQYE